MSLDLGDPVCCHTHKVQYDGMMSPPNSSLILTGWSVCFVVYIFLQLQEEDDIIHTHHSECFLCLKVCLKLKLSEAQLRLPYVC